MTLIHLTTNSQDPYLSTKNDNNFLVVLTSLNQADLKKISTYQNKWANKYKASPLFLTKQDINTSADIFPIEFLDMQNSYNLIWGEDVLKDLQIPQEHLRTQCEYSLKGKIIILRQGYYNNPNQINWLLQNSWNAFLTVFKNILRLSQNTLPINTEETIQSLCKLYQGNHSIYLQVAQHASGQNKLNKPQGQEAFSQYLAELEKLATFVDQLKT